MFELEAKQSEIIGVCVFFYLSVIEKVREEKKYADEIYLVTVLFAFFPYGHKYAEWEAREKEI